MSIILASASPRRKELMQMLGVKELQIEPALSPETAAEGLGPEELVKELALHKAREVASGRQGADCVVGADTIVWFSDRVFGKPKSEDEAFSMLQSLSGQWHEVYTGVAVLKNGKSLCRAVRSRVKFRPLEEREIWAYIASGEPMDKAGAYGAQGLAALFVERIEGDFFNVMGLPLCTLGEMLKEQGVVLL